MYESGYFYLEKVHRIAHRSMKETVLSVADCMCKEFGEDRLQKGFVVKESLYGGSYETDHG